MNDEKAAIRKRIRERRRRLDPDTVAAVGRRVARSLLALDVLQQARSVVGYLEAENEVPAAGLLQAAVCAGQGTFLLKCGGMPRAVPWRPGEPLVTGRGGVPEPREERSAMLLGPVAFLVPVVAFDEQGSRLGRGGGAYDRLFEDLGCGPDMVRLGLAYEFQRVEGIPQDARDVPLNYVITEDRIVRCGDRVDRA